MSELDKTIEELESDVLADLDEAKVKKEASAGKGSVKAEPMKKVDAEEDDVEDLGPAVVKGDEKSGPDAGKSAKKDTTVKEKSSKSEETKKIKEDTESSEDEIVSESNTPKTKAAAIEAISASLSKMSATQVKELHASMHNKKEMTEEELEMEGLAKAKEAIEKRLASINVQEDVEALVQGEELSEEFKKKAATIFEAAVKSKIRPEVERIETEKTSEINEEMESFKTELAEKVDGYLDYVVKEWMKENELAVERGLKGEIAEDFISGLKSLFEEHYIDVPDEKYDILESQAQKIEELEGKLNETLGKLTEKKQSEDTLVREAVIKEVSSDLAETQIEKFAGLVEDVEFSDKDAFTEKLNTLKENYFPKSTPTETLTEEGNGNTQDIDISDAMAAYTTAINRTAGTDRVFKRADVKN